MKKICAFALTLVMMLSLSLSAVAVNSPTGTTTHSVKSYLVSLTSGTSTLDWAKVVVDGDTITLTVNPEYADYFLEWVISGEYEIVAGSLTSKTLVIRLLSDLIIQQKINCDIKTPGGTNTSPVSPDTGANAVPALVVIMSLSALTAFAAKKKISE